MRIIIADDDAIVVRSLAAILGAQDDIEIAGCAADGTQAAKLFLERRPDIALLDIQMGEHGGMEAAETILAFDPEAKIVFLTTFSDDEYIVRALKLGARGYLIKQDVATIAPALRSVMAGQSVLEGEVLARAARISAAPARDPSPQAFLGPLTERERQIVEAIAEGKGNGEIARSLSMSEGTLRNHISDMLAKLGLKNRTQLAVWYLRGGTLRARQP